MMMINNQKQRYSLIHTNDDDSLDFFSIEFPDWIVYQQKKQKKNQVHYYYYYITHHQHQQRSTRAKKKTWKSKSKCFKYVMWLMLYVVSCFLVFFFLICFFFVRSFLKAQFECFRKQKQYLIENDNNNNCENKTKQNEKKKPKGKKSYSE